VAAKLADEQRTRGFSDTSSITSFNKNQTHHNHQYMASVFVVSTMLPGLFFFVLLN